MKTRSPLMALLVVTIAGGLYAQDDAVEKSESETPAPPVTAITGADIYTVTGEIIRGGTVLVSKGKITAVGQNVEIPDQATVIDATGKVVAPGFIALSVSRLGVRGTPGDNDKLADSLDPFDQNMKFALGSGITTSCVQLSAASGRRRRGRDVNPEEQFLGLEPQPREFLTQEEVDFGPEDTSVCPCCGLPVIPTEPITESPPSETQPRDHAVLKMSYGHLDSMLVKEDAFYDLAPGALTGGLNRHNWRRDIKKAKEAVARAEENQARGESAESDSAQRQQRRSARGRGGGGRNAVSDDLMRLVKKEVALRIQANTVDEIRDMIALANELDYDLVIEGGIEAWLVAGELSQSDVSVIFTPRRRRQARRGYEDTSGSSIESTGVFQKSGVPFATAALSSSVSMGGIAGRDLTSLPLEAAFAVRGGASNETALESLTIVPAQMLGLDDRIGSIEEGKDADLLILNGPPLDYRTYVETAIVAGNVCYERSQDRIYPIFERD